MTITNHPPHPKHGETFRKHLQSTLFARCLQLAPMHPWSTCVAPRCKPAPLGPRASSSDPGEEMPPLRSMERASRTPVSAAWQVRRAHTRMKTGGRAQVCHKHRHIPNLTKVLKPDQGQMKWRPRCRLWHTGPKCRSPRVHPWPSPTAFLGSKRHPAKLGPRLLLTCGTWNTSPRQAVPAPCPVGGEADSARSTRLDAFRLQDSTEHLLTLTTWASWSQTSAAVPAAISDTWETPRGSTHWTSEPYSVKSVCLLQPQNHGVSDVRIIVVWTHHDFSCRMLPSQHARRQLCTNHRVLRMSVRRRDRAET